MRHRRRGRKLGRNPNHQRALLRNLASALILTERDAEGENNAPKVKGRIITTLQKAKEVRPLVEKCVTIARKALPHLRGRRASSVPTPSGTASSGSPGATATAGSSGAGRSPRWSPPAAACWCCWATRKPCKILFDDIAPRFEDRPGGYTRVLQLAKPRLGDAGPRAILEFVGKHDRIRREAAKPSFEAEEPETPAAEEPESPATETPETPSQPAAEPSSQPAEKLITPDEPDLFRPTGWS